MCETDQIKANVLSVIPGHYRDYSENPMDGPQACSQQAAQWA